MDESIPDILRPPIVEAVVDVDCDLPSGVRFDRLDENLQRLLQSRYPKHQAQMSQEIRLEASGDSAPKLATHVGIQALQFRTEDERQLVQIRQQGFSFNRLAPYSSFDDYLPEIEWAWEIYRNLAKPVRIRVVRLRYINRILLPLESGTVDIEKYIRIAPRMPDEEGFFVAGFLTNLFTIQRDTGLQVTISLSLQPTQGDRLPIIFDNMAADVAPLDEVNWSALLPKLRSLRALKNHTFKNSLHPECIALFQQ